VFSSLRAAQQALDDWVLEYNTQRPHQSLDGATPAERFSAHTGAGAPPPTTAISPTDRDRRGESWVSRRVAVNGVISVSWQQICLGIAHAGAQVDVHVHDQLLQIWRGNELIKTVHRTSRGEIRKKNASVHTTRT
jgi:hypothetical protein